MPVTKRSRLILQKQLYEIGVDMEIEALPGKDLVAPLSAGQFDMLLMERTSGRSLAWTYLLVPLERIQPGTRPLTRSSRSFERTTADAGVRTAVSDLQQIFHDDPQPSSSSGQMSRAQSVRSSWCQDEGGSDVMSRILALASGRDRPMRRITSRFVLLIASAAIAPLVVYGAISLLNLRQGTESSVSAGNQRVADQVAEQIGQYITNNTRVLKSVGLTLRGIRLEPWQQSRVLKDYVIDFPEFREITFFGAGGRMIATSRTGDVTLSIPDATDVGSDGIYIAPLQIDDDGLPRTTIAVQVRPTGQEPGWVVAEIWLEDIWKAVDRVRVGDQGFALLRSE